MKKYLLLSIMLLLFVTGCFSSKSVERNDEANNIGVNEIKELEESNDSDETKEDEVKKEEDETEKEESTVSVDKEIKEEKQSTEVVNKPTEEKKTTNNVVKEEVKQDSPNNVVNNSENEQKASTEIPIWEEYGMTKDEYENTPMGGWRKVTHSSYDECKSAGQSLIDDESNDYTTFWCYEVISYSGKQLGYMLDPE